MALITITKGVTTVEVEPIPGTLTFDASDELRGGSDRPNVNAATGRSGSFEVLITSDGANDTATIAELESVVSAEGEGDVEVACTDGTAFDCLLNIEITGDSVQSAIVTFKGTKASA